MTPYERMREMKSTDPGLEALVAKALDQEESQRLSPDELASLMAGPLDAEERGALVDRLLADTEAVRTLQELRDLDSWSRKTANALIGVEAVNNTDARASRRPFFSRASSSRHPWSSRPHLLALAATVLLAMGLAFVLPRLEGPPQTTTRRAALQPEVMYEPADGARLKQAPELFRWTFSESAATDEDVRMLLFDENTELLWRSPRTRDHQVRLPAEWKSRLDAGGTFFWRLSIDDGLETRLSFLAGFEIRP